MEAALGVIACGIGIVLSRRFWARRYVATFTTYDRAFDEDGIAWRYGALGALVVTSGVVLLFIALR